MLQSLRKCSGRQQSSQLGLWVDQKAKHTKFCHRISHVIHLMTQQVVFTLTPEAAESVHFTGDQLEKLGASGGLGGFTPPGSFPVSDLVTCDLPILAVQGRGLPP